MKIVQSHTVELVTREQAEVITHELRNSLERTHGLIKHCLQIKVWEPMGYASWSAYIAGEFSEGQLAVAKSDRANVIKLLDDSGLTQRAIAAATGESKGTVSRALAATAPDGALDETPETKVGIDGKTRAARKPTVNHRSNQPIPNVRDTDEPDDIRRARQSWRNVCNAAELVVDLPMPVFETSEKRRMVRQLKAALTRLEAQ